ncbi:MAG: helix-turn-helix domain-containing protein [Alistipes sp.]
MKDKLRILMQKEHLTATKLAEILDAKPAGISHILNGRNHPSYELVCKIINRFPHINPYWLFGDSDKIYNDSETSSVQATNDDVNGANTSNIHEAGLFDEFVSNNRPVSDEFPQHDEDIAELQPKYSVRLSSCESSAIDKIIVIYHNGTFEYYTPKK